MPTPLVAARLALLLLVACAGALMADDAGWAMRARVFCDSQSGISFRYPYDYRVPDQYKPELLRAESEVARSGVISEVLINGKLEKVFIANQPQPSGPDVRAFSSLASQLPAGSPTELSAIGNQLTGRTLTWKAFDYYQKSGNRPQAVASWAPKDVVAMIGDSGTSCGLVVKHGLRYSGLVLSGGLSSGDNQAIIDSFEVMAGGKGKLPFQTWREGQAHAGRVMAADGKPITASGHGPAAWKDAWTSRPRITTSPPRSRPRAWCSTASTSRRSTAPIPASTSPTACRRTSSRSTSSTPRRTS